jgi:addiction module HigA family antidote
MKKMTRKPTSPGEILHEEFLTPMGLTQKQLADHISVDLKVINRIVKERSGVSPIVAVKLAYALGTSPEFWLNAQMAVDVYHAEEKLDVPPRLLKGPRSA